ncbi:nuclear transport factor 2 family protein [Salisaeta longa]|uniref:nuclear transport factor 2 family protein n=1 Tax=Salisaeta longa TaxID=503170 RepID=UPI00146CCD15|nr:DUF4440 domain-containing protein [Salisaeta longa]
MATVAHAQKMPVTTTSDAARSHYVQGKHATGNVDFERARMHFDAALATDSTFAMAYLYRAVLSGGDERVEHLRRATVNAAQASDAERQMIESYAANQRNDHGREEALLTALAERYPSDPMPMFWWANTEANRGNHAAAVAAARRSLAADPSFAPAYNLMGYAEVARGDMAAAKQAFREYIRLAPDEANPYDSFGEFYLNQGMLDEAAAQYKMALTKNARFENARTMLARIGMERSDRRFEQALADGDADAIAALYTPNAVVMAPDLSPIQGRDAIRDHMAGMIASGVDIQTVEVNRSGDIAIRRSNVITSSEGEVVDRAKTLEVWTLVDGKWLCARDMYSSNALVKAASNQN